MQNNTFIIKIINNEILSKTLSKEYLSVCTYYKISVLYSTKILTSHTKHQKINTLYCSLIKDTQQQDTLDTQTAEGGTPPGLFNLALLSSCGKSCLGRGSAKAFLTDLPTQNRTLIQFLPDKKTNKKLSKTHSYHDMLTCYVKHN